ncbi:MAG: ROK family protein [Beutenbergiaceae bacterium]
MQFNLTLPTPRVLARLGREDVASLIAKLIASGAARSRAELGRATGLSRTTIDAGTNALLDLGAVQISGLEAAAGRGRPAELLEIAPDFGAVLVADCGATFARIALFDLGQNLLEGHEIELPITRGPTAVLRTIVEMFRALLSNARAGHRPRSAIVGLPGPVDYRAGTLVRPPIMPGWDGYPVVAELESELDCVAQLENDVNLRALGEARTQPPLHGPVLYIKVGTGIGVGIVSADGTLLRGADGSAGDVGHVRVPEQDALCTCGSRGCLEAVASIRAVGRALGIEESSEIGLVHEVIERINHHDARTLEVITERAHYIGDTTVSLVHYLNPERIVIGGVLAMASDNLLATTRSVVYRRALPLATRTLVISRPLLDNRSGLAGGLALGLDSALDPPMLARRMGI